MDIVDTVDAIADTIGKVGTWMRDHSKIITMTGALLAAGVGIHYMLSPVQEVTIIKHNVPSLSNLDAVVQVESDRFGRRNVSMKVGNLNKQATAFVSPEYFTVQDVGFNGVEEIREYRTEGNKFVQELTGSGWRAYFDRFLNETRPEIEQALTQR